MRARANTIFLLFLLQTAFIPFAIAQNSASSVMDVSLRVVEASNITAVPDAQLIMDRDGKISGTLGYVAITGLNKYRMVVETPKMLKLYDTDGNRINLPVSVSHSRTSDEMNVEFATHKSGIEKNRKQVLYHGTITTKIEYL